MRVMSTSLHFLEISAAIIDDSYFQGKDGDLSKKFWSTKDPGQQPFSFKIGMGSVIRGWDEGVMGMEIGEIASLQCSPDYAYGANGFPAWGIQPNSVLLFEIEVLAAQ